MKNYKFLYFLLFFIFGIITECFIFFLNSYIETNILNAIFILSFFILPISFIFGYFSSKFPLSLHKKLLENFEKLRKISNISNKHLMSLSLDKDGKIIFASVALHKKLKYENNTLLNKNYSSIFSKLDFFITFKKSNFKQILKEKKVIAFTKDGSTLLMEQNIVSVIDYFNINQEYNIVFIDITYEKEIERKSITDPLTKLYNRAKIYELLEQELKFSKRYKNNFAIFMIDIDFFKKVNDTQGHQKGDQILMDFADNLKKSMRNTDVVGRYGGEEFLAILHSVNKETSIKLAEKIRFIIEKTMSKDKITTSIGISLSKINDNTESIVKRADEALYEAKKAGRNLVKFKD